MFLFQRDGMTFMMLPVKTIQFNPAKSKIMHARMSVIHCSNTMHYSEYLTVDTLCVAYKSCVSNPLFTPDGRL